MKKAWSDSLRASAPKRWDEDAELRGRTETYAGLLVLQRKLGGTREVVGESLGT